MEEVKKRVGAGFGVILLREEGGVSKVLLGKRHEDPEKASSELNGAGRWSLPGGKLDFGETFEEGAAREVFEETGIKVDPTSLTLVSLANERVPTAHFVTMGWVAAKFEGEAQVMEPDEMTQWQWFPLAELPEPMYFPS